MPDTPVLSVEDQALALPLKARAQLAQRLLASLDETDGQDHTAAWLAVAEERYRAYKADPVGSVSAEELMQELSAKLRQR